MPKQTLTPAQHKRLIRLSQKLSRVLNLDTPARNPTTGTFTGGSAITGKALKAAWSLGGMRASAKPADAFKSQLLAALRAPQK